MIPINDPNSNIINKDSIEKDSFVNSKRLCHLRSLLDQFDNNDDISDISADVYQCIKQEMTKRHIQKDDLNIQRIQNILKKLNFRKYYEHAPAIFFHLTGKNFIKINDEDKYKIITVFKEIIVSYQYCCPANRLSFLNYNYILQKICIMLDMNEYLVLFNLPNGYKRNQVKMSHNESIWNKLCEYIFNNWKNYPGCTAITY